VTAGILSKIFFMIILTRRKSFFCPLRFILKKNNIFNEKYETMLKILSSSIYCRTIGISHFLM
jgi:hypothetical protein